MSETISRKKVHHGKNIKFAREFLNERSVTQDELAELMGTGFFQKNISQLEAKVEIDDCTLEKAAKALNVPFRFLKEYSLEENVRKIMENHGNSHTFNDSSSENIGNDQSFHFYESDKTFEVYDRLVQYAEENGSMREQIKYLTEKLMKYESK
ncbi:MAG: helix-turn-helix domain-containing protein [Tannerella sp.]|jgi:transcriptional regulator with XRE-family HTH domain|nr:helix-turn-helix domain-containing protein [Tannerella sp.]